MSGGGYPKFKNDRGVPEICIGVKEFMCIGESPPQDHPHVYINMGEADTILCPYCATRFRFDPRLTPLDADPPDSFFADHNAVLADPRQCSITANHVFGYELPQNPRAALADADRVALASRSGAS